MDSKLTKFQSIWNQRYPVTKKFVLELNGRYELLNEDLKGAARILGCSAGELYAHLRLMDMDSSLEEIFYSQIPPKTTWLQLLSAEPDRAVSALHEFNSLGVLRTRKSPWGFMNTLLNGDNSDPEDLVRDLPYTHLLHAHKKATLYDVLTTRQLNFLKQMANGKKASKTMTLKQASWLLSILRKLRDADAISLESVDGDIKENEVILRAIEGD